MSRSKRPHCRCCRRRIWWRRSTRAAWRWLDQHGPRVAVIIAALSLIATVAGIVTR